MRPKESLLDRSCKQQKVRAIPSVVTTPLMLKNECSLSVSRHRYPPFLIIPSAPLFSNTLSRCSSTVVALGLTEPQIFTMAELMFGLSQTKKKKSEEAKVRTTKSSLKDVNITDTIEKEVRKEHHQREQTWKQMGREQMKKNTNFDMARSLFGGGGPTRAAVDTEDDDDLEEETKQPGAAQLHDDVQEEGEAEEEADEDFGEEEGDEEERKEENEE